VMYRQPSVNESGVSYIEIDGLRVRYQTAGSGEPVLLLHGWGGSIESMTPVFNEFVKHYRVVSIDFPGHGESALPPRAWHVDDFVVLVLHLMDALHLNRPYIIAHSHGGRVTLKLAALYPDRVGKLVLVNSAGVPPPRAWNYYLRVAVAKFGKVVARFGGAWGEHVRRRLYSAVASSDYMAAGPLRGTFVNLVKEDLTPILSTIQSPTLLVWGEHDTDTPVSCATIMARHIPKAELVVLQHAGHFSYLDQFGKFRLLVGRFLRD
jgi:pimeloyl-ACP methyl ester carboxylesterase